MNAAVVLSLIGDLYVQIQNLQAKVEELEAEKAERDVANVRKEPSE